MRTLGVLALTCTLTSTLSAVSLVAQESPPEVSPRPVERPTPDAPDSSDAPDTADTSDALLAAAGDADAAVVVEVEGQRDLLRLDDANYTACLARLDAAGVTYTEVAPIIPETDRDCGILRPLEVTAIGDVRIAPPATLRCPTAEALAEWTHDFVLPASLRLTDRGALKKIENGSGYICRRRNNAADGKLSEHAFGNAFDVMGFGFDDDSRIAIRPREAEGTMAEAFQDAVRASACLDFTTVLGPGSNASHDDHLHLDIVARSSGYRLCEQGGAVID